MDVKDYKIMAFKAKFKKLEELMMENFNNGDLVVKVPYSFFSSDMEFLAYCIDELAGKGFILRMYRDRMEICFN